MAMAMLARALSLRRANQRAKALHQGAAGDAFTEYGTESSLEQSAIHSSRVSQSIDALYVLSCLRDGLSLVDTFASDGDCVDHIASYRPSDIEKLILSSQSLSEHARSSDACDCYSSSLSSFGSESAELFSKDALRGHRNCSSSAENKEDFCFVFNTEQLVSSPSPPVAIASDCCGFLMGRKSNHNEDDAQKLASRSGNGERLAENVQRRDKLRHSNGCAEDGLSISRMNKLYEGKRDREEHDAELQRGAIVGVLSRGNIGAEVQEESEELQRLLREGAMEAVEKQSCDPYLDFRESMQQMMVFAWDNSSSRQRKRETAGSFNLSVDKYIEDLLYCYLRLNSMELHELITQAFSDTCSELFSKIKAD